MLWCFPFGTFHTSISEPFLPLLFPCKPENPRKYTIIYYKYDNIFWWLSSCYRSLNSLQVKEQLKVSELKISLLTDLTGCTLVLNYITLYYCTWAYFHCNFSHFTWLTACFLSLLFYRKGKKGQSCKHTLASAYKCPRSKTLLHTYQTNRMNYKLKAYMPLGVIYMILFTVLICSCVLVNV